MPRLSLGLGVQAVSKVKAGGPPPSGIPVASTSNILITFPSLDLLLEPYSRIAITNAAYDPTIYSDYKPALRFNFYDTIPNTWSFLEADGEGGWIYRSTNPSANGAYIPTSGWTVPITITAA
jgi:hypothetical protein